jgi:protein TonB
MSVLKSWLWAAFAALLFHAGLAWWLMSLTLPAKTQPVELLSMEWVDSPLPEPVIAPSNIEPLITEMESVDEPEPVLVSKAVASPPPPPKQPEPKPVTKPVKPVVTKVPVSQPATVQETTQVSESTPTSVKATASASDVVKPVIKAQADYLNNPKPSYPRLSKRMGEQGEVRLRVDIASDGTVTQVVLAHSSGFERLDDAAINAVKSWKFKPAKQGDVSMASTVEIPVKFMLEDE